MFHIFREELLLTVVMVCLLAGGIWLRILLAVLYRKMISEADNMAATSNKLLKQCKLKFANCYQLNNGVANIPIFVDKFLNKMSLGIFSFETLYHLSNQAVLLSVMTAGVGVCKSIVAGKALMEILPFYISAFAGLYLYFSVAAAADIKGKRRILKVNLVDYLENHLSARMQVTELDLGMLYGKRTEEETEVTKILPVEELDDLLKEFLTI